MIYKYYSDTNELLVDVVKTYFKFDHGIFKTISSREGTYLEKVNMYVDAYSSYYESYYTLSTLALQYEELLHNTYTRDIVLAEGACTNSAFASQYRLKGTFAPTADFGLLNAAYTAAGKSGLSVKVGNVLSSDTFYCDDPDANDGWIRMGVLCIEMESAALYMEAARLHKKALSILTISDEILTGRELSSDQRERSFTRASRFSIKIEVRIFFCSPVRCSVSSFRFFSIYFLQG